MKRNKTAAKLPAKSSKQVKVDRDKLNSVIRAALKSTYGKVCPVLGVLGQRFAVPSKSQGFPYYRVLCDTPDGLKALFVSGFYEGEMRTAFNDVKKNSYTVSRLLARIEARTKRAAAKLAREKEGK